MDSIEKKLFARFGALLGGADLYSVLGFKTYSAFYRAKELGNLGVGVFQLPGRRGWFALTEDVSTWLRERARGAGSFVSGGKEGGTMDP